MKKKLLFITTLLTISGLAFANPTIPLTKENINQPPVAFLLTPHSATGMSNLTDRQMSIRIGVTHGWVHIISSDPSSLCGSATLKKGEEVVCTIEKGKLIDIVNNSDLIDAEGSYQVSIPTNA